jgi:uncharacterized BrkB/YihY/UPF0761 family membrane protein
LQQIDRLIAAADGWQRSKSLPGLSYGVIKKFGDDEANQYVVALGWYGFVAIYPLLLVVITLFGFVGAAALGHRLVVTLHQFPVVGSQFNPAHSSDSLHGSVPGLVIGLVGLIYGAQGVTQTAQQAMAAVWNIPRFRFPAFLPRLARSLTGLLIIGGAFVFNAALATFATSSGVSYAIRIPTFVGMLALNTLLYLAAFHVLTPGAVDAARLLPGAAVSSVGFTLLITIGSGLVQHQLRNSSNTYGQFGIVIGLVGFLFLLAKISLYGAELNSVLASHQWPRGIQSDNPTKADNQVLHDITHQSLRRADQRIGVGFGDNAADEAAADARRADPAPINR